MYIYIYIYVYVCICIYICIYIGARVAAASGDAKQDPSTGTSLRGKMYNASGMSCHWLSLEVALSLLLSLSHTHTLSLPLTHSHPPSLFHTHTHSGDPKQDPSTGTNLRVGCRV